MATHDEILHAIGALADGHTATTDCPACVEGVPWCSLCGHTRPLVPGVSMCIACDRMTTPSAEEVAAWGGTVGRHHTREATSC